MSFSTSSIIYHFWVIFWPVSWLFSLCLIIFYWIPDIGNFTFLGAIFIFLKIFLSFILGLNYLETVESFQNLLLSFVSQISQFFIVGLLWLNFWRNAPLFWVSLPDAQVKKTVYNRHCKNPGIKDCEILLTLNSSIYPTDMHVFNMKYEFKQNDS